MQRNRRNYRIGPVGAQCIEVPKALRMKTRQLRCDHPDWIFFESALLRPSTVVLAILREAGGVLTFPAILGRLLELRPSTLPGRIKHICRRHEGELVVPNKVRVA